MDIDSPPGQCRVRRSILNSRGVILAEGDFQPMLRGYLDHAKRWDREPDPLGTMMMRQGLAAAALYLSCRPKDEVIGWTLNLKDPPLNVFITGDSHRSHVTGRLFTEGVDVGDVSRFYVQSQRLHGEPSQTVIEVDGLDVLQIFERYYLQSEQHSARFFDYDDGSTLMVLALPDADKEWLTELTRDDARKLADQDARPLDEPLFRFACGCGPDRMKEVVAGVYQDRLEELFEGDPTVTVQCPRCGHQWDLSEDDLR